MEFGLTGCQSAVAVLKLLGLKCCVRGLLLFLEGGDCILILILIKISRILLVY